jgi:hypothetical protein
MDYFIKCSYIAMQVYNNTLITGRGLHRYIDNNSSEISNNTLFNAAIFSIKISDNSQINNNTTISEVDYFIAILGEYNDEKL